jgi:dTDP-4-amino-4,6-dideoxygalactose transaminase
MRLNAWAVLSTINRWVRSVIACLSFDYMKNVSYGHGGLLIVNDRMLLQKVQTTFDTGTNRQVLVEGIQKQFDWVSKGRQ